MLANEGLYLGDVLDIMNEVAPGITLAEAMRAASNILQLHAIAVREARSKSYDEGYNSGHQVGSSINRVPTPDEWELQKLRRVYDAQVKQAQELVKEATRKHGTKRKIQIIKDIRNSTGLGLKDSKDIVDKYIADLVSGLADWERELLEMPRAVRYSDEPTF
jgi:predicted RNase H-like HicB family nuclease